MNVFGMRQEVVFAGPVDLKGFEVVALDGRIGKVDDASFADRTGCLVVDTGFWIFAKKRLIPAGVIQSIDWDERSIAVGMTKEEIKDAPDLDEVRHRDNEADYHDEVGPYFDAWMD